MGQGILFVLSGPSGVGKGTVLERLLKDFTGVRYSVSATTRKPRSGEKDGVDYFFHSEKEFIKMRDNKEFIETALVHNNYYGTPKKFVDKCLKDGEDIILEIDIEGAKQVRELYPNAVFIFLIPPSFEELKRRLDIRNSENNRSKEIRLRNAIEEMKMLDNYDYKIINDDLIETVEKIKEIILLEKSKRKG